LPLRILFENPTIKYLSQIIDSNIGRNNSNTSPILPIVRTEQMELSFAQQRLWFIDQLDEGNAFYNITTAIKFKGDLNVEILNSAINEIIKRHEILRTNFISVEGVPVQTIHSKLDINISVINFDNQFDSIEDILNSEMVEGFNLSSDHLIRAKIISFSKVENIFLLTIHHIISDGWSMNIFIQELMEIYNANLSGRVPNLKELNIQYVDFTYWQKKLLNKELIENQANYWLDNLKESSTLLSLPTDYSRPSVQTYNGKSTSFVIPDLLLKKIYRLGKEEQVTLFMLLTATFNILLSKYSGQKDICIGTPIANRTNIEIEPLIGFFVNTLVLRTKIEDSFTFIDLLKQVYNTTLGAYANQDIPFEQVVDRIKPERHTSHSPLFQVMLALQNISEEEIFFNGLTTEFIPVNNSISKFDLTLTMVEGKDKLYGA
ncbi:non-ribosomal peptide synthetase, partial [Acinetobacter pittii]